MFCQLLARFSQGQAEAPGGPGRLSHGCCQLLSVCLVSRHPSPSHSPSALMLGLAGGTSLYTGIPAHRLGAGNNPPNTYQAHFKSSLPSPTASTTLPRRRPRPKPTPSTGPVPPGRLGASPRGPAGRNPRVGERSAAPRVAARRRRRGHGAAAAASFLVPARGRRRGAAGAAEGPGASHGSSWPGTSGRARTSGCRGRGPGGGLRGAAFWPFVARLGGAGPLGACGAGGSPEPGPAVGARWWARPAAVSGLGWRWWKWLGWVAVCEGGVWAAGWCWSGCRYVCVCPGRSVPATGQLETAGGIYLSSAVAR